MLGLPTPASYKTQTYEKLLKTTAFISLKVSKIFIENE